MAIVAKHCLLTGKQFDLNLILFVTCSFGVLSFIAYDRNYD